MELAPASRELVPMEDGRAGVIGARAGPLEAAAVEARRPTYPVLWDIQRRQMHRQLGEYLKGLAPDAIIRNGDYPRERGGFDVSVILSELRNVEKIKRYYTEAAGVVSTIKRRQRQIEAKLKEIDEYSKDVPSLL